MKHIEASRKIVLAQEMEAEVVKERIVTRFKNIVDSKSITEGIDNFSVRGLYRPGANVGNDKTKLDLTVSLDCDGKVARIVVEGSAMISKVLIGFYGLSLLVILLLGLLPGSINTGADGGAADALVFLFIGAFMVFDISKRLVEPQSQIENLLKSLDTELG